MAADQSRQQQLLLARKAWHVGMLQKVGAVAVILGVCNVEAGFKLTPLDLAAAEQKRQEVFHRMRALFDFTPIDEMLERGVTEFARGLVADFEELSADIQRAYFPRLLVTA